MSDPQSNEETEYQRVAAYCTARSYKLFGILDKLKSEFPCTLYDDVLQFQAYGGDVFCFGYGCVVFWNMDESKERRLIDKLSAFERDSLKTIEEDTFTYEIGGRVRFHRGHITLADEEDMLTKLSISFGLAQSVKLAFFESRIEHTIKVSETITDALASTGRIPYSRREIGRKIGKLFMERSSINLHIDFLNPPDFFWENPDLEPFFKMSVKELDVAERSEILNKKLDIIHELFQLLGDELNYRHSTQLEWVIIVLISFEVTLSLWHHFGQQWFAG
ncbi:MAG: RMD1 family protein [Holosporales bacterium]